MDIEKLKALQSEIEKQAKKEIYERLPEGLIHFFKDDIIDYSLNQVKTRNYSEQSARVLNSWIEQGLIKVNKSDKGKINRFTREEAIWLGLVHELRAFGVSLDKLQKIRLELFNEPFPAFTLFRFAIIRTVFGNTQFLIVSSDGALNLMSSNLYKKWMSKKILPSHICVNFLKLLSDVFTKNIFKEYDLHDGDFENNHWIKISYFLNTGDFESFKIEITKGDIRLIENSQQLLSNLTLSNAVINGNYLKVEVISNGKSFLIKP